MKKEQSLRHSSKLGYASLLFGLTFLTQLYHGFNFDYYLNSGLVTITLATTCKIIFVVVDSVNDLLFGYLSEKTKSKYGKRIPWIMYGAIFVPVFVILTYIVSASTPFSGLGFFFYYLLISIMLENASTVMYTNYFALFPTLFTSNKERTQTASYRHLFEVAGMILCYLLTPILVADCGVPYWACGIIYGLVYMISVGIFLKTINYKDDVNAQIDKGPSFTLRQTIKDVWQEKPFFLFYIAQSFFNSIMAIVVSLYPMYCRYVLKIQGWQQSIVLGCLLGTTLVFLPVWYFLIRKLSHTKTYLIAYITLPIACLGLYFPQDFISGVVVCCLVGPFLGGLILAPDMIGAELVDIDKLKFKVSREAALGSLSSLIGRISVVLTAIATSLLATFFGYKSGAQPGDNPELTFRVCFGIMLPIIGFLGLCFAIWYIYASRKDRMLLSALKREVSDETTEVSLQQIFKAEGKNKKNEQQSPENKSSHL